jgi:hypothetical protein
MTAHPWTHSRDHEYRQQELGDVDVMKKNVDLERGMQSRKQV